MKNQTHKTHSFLVSYGKWILRRKWLILIGSIVFTFLLGYGFQFLTFNSDSKVFFSEDNPQLIAYEKLEEVYTDDDNILIAIEATKGSIFERNNLSAIVDLVDRSWQVPFSFRVDGLTNYQYTRAKGDNLYVSNLVEDPASLTTQDLERIKQIAIQDPIIGNRLINESGTVAGINIVASLPNDPVAQDSTVNFVRAMVEDWEDENPQLKTYLSGNVMLSAAFSETAQEDQQTLVPLVFLAFLIIIGLTTRSFTGTVASLIVIFLSISCALALAALLGIDLTAASANTPIVITTLAIADSIHILITVIATMKKGATKQEAIIESLRVNFLPVFLTSITTIIGFLSLNTGDVPPYADFGNISAMGMFFAFTFSILTLPALLAIMPMRVKVEEEEQSKAGFYSRLSEWVAGNRKTVFAGSVAIFIIGAFFTSRNDISDQVLEYFDTRIQFRNDSDFINQNLTGIYNLEFSIPAGESGGINNPEYLENLEKFKGYVEQQPEVIHVSSFSTIAQKVNKAMHGDSTRYYTIPSSREAAAQYLLIYELSLPYGLDLNNQVDVDKSETRFTITLEDISSAEMLAFTARLENWLSKNAPTYMEATGISYPVIFAYLSKRQIDSLILGSIISAILITLIISISFKDLRYGVISMIPNIAPAVIGFGIWYLMYGMVNLGMTAVFGMTLGIIVDYTVHFLAKYLRAKKEFGYGTLEAIHYSYTTVGKAIVVTTVVLCTGFLILTFSSFLLNSALAAITIIILIAALLVDFIALPGALLLFEKKPSQTQTSVKTDNKMKPLIATILLFLCVTTAWSQSPDPKGLEIARKADQADVGFESAYADLEMILTNKHGQTSTRLMSNKILEGTEDGDKSLIEFESPKDVQGTKTLTHSHKNSSDDQWIFLPSIKRVKRISSDNKSGPFMGSEFAYEDLSSQEVEKYTYGFIGEKVIDGERLALVEQYPVDPKSGYSKRIAHYNLDQDYRIEKIIYFDRKGVKLKTLDYVDYKLYLDKFWRAQRLSMTNHQNGKKTDLIFNAYKFKTGLSESDFSQASLR